MDTQLPYRLAGTAEAPAPLPALGIRPKQRQALLTLLATLADDRENLRFCGRAAGMSAANAALEITRLTGLVTVRHLLICPQL